MVVKIYDGYAAGSTVMDIQATGTLAKNLRDLPSECDVGSKKNSKGYYRDLDRLQAASCNFGKVAK